MKIIKDSITWGVIAHPLKRNLVSRFTNGGAQGNDEEWLDVEKENGISRQLKRGNVPSFPASFSFP
jgi:hypothetical protein